MNTRAILAAAVALGAAGLAQQASAATCDDIELNPTLTTEYPNIRRTCRGIVNYEGADYMKQEARVMNIHRDGRIGLRFKHSDGSMGKTIELQAPPDFTVTIDGKPRKLTALSRGDSVQILLRGRDANYYAVNETTVEPVATTAAVATYESEPEPTQQLAQTASPVPLIGLLGGVFALFGAGLTIARRWLR